MKHQLRHSNDFTRRDPDTERTAVTPGRLADKPAAPVAASSVPSPHPGLDPVRYDDAIRTRAYHLWEDAGRPEGDGVRFWLTAERELKG